MSTLSKNKKHAKRSGKKMLLIFNPVSGKSQIRTDLVDIVQILSDKDYLVTCYPTKCKGDARDMVMHRPDDYDVVVCAGGDGTVDEVVSGMMDSTDKPLVPMGYIPCGTTNDFAASLGISSDMKQAAKAVANASSTRTPISPTWRLSAFSQKLHTRLRRTSRTSSGTRPMSCRA